MTTDTFDWNDTDDVVIASQPATAVYANVNGFVVIRQEGGGYCDDDTWVVINPLHARDLCRAIMECVGTRQEEPEPAPKATAAERQRRYRDKHRNGESVTRDAPTVTPDRNATVTRDAELPFNLEPDE